MAINTSYQSNPLLQTKPTVPSFTPAPQPYAPAPTTSTTAAPSAAPTTAPAETIAQTYARGQAVLDRNPGNIQASAPEQTIGQSFNPPGFESGYPSYNELYSPVDEKAINRNQMKLFQQEINATNQVYDQMLNEAKLQGTGRLGTQRAAAARGGLIGSDFGIAQEDKVGTYNRQVEAGVQAERQAKIGSIMGQMRQAVAAEIAAKRKARGEDAESYINYLAGAKERKQGNLNLAASAFVTQGIDPSTLSPDELQAIATEAGVSTGDLINQYLVTKGQADSAAAEGELKTAKTQAEINKINADIESGKLITIGEGTTLYNTETGEKWKNPKTYAPKSGSSESGAVSLTSEDKRTLLGGGWSETDISAIEGDVRAYGLTDAIANAKENGASASQISALQKAYGASGDTNQFLTKDYFRSLFGDEALASSAKEAGLVDKGSKINPFDNKGDSEAYLNQLDSTVNLYRQAGYTDQEILKLMQ